MKYLLNILSQKIKYFSDPYSSSFQLTVHRLYLKSFVNFFFFAWADSVGSLVKTVLNIKKNILLLLLVQF